MKERVLVTGAFGQIGTELVPALQNKAGVERVVAMGHLNIPTSFDGVIETGDVTDKTKLEEIIKKHGIETIFHMASLLSVSGEKNPQLALDLNINGLRNVLNLAVQHKLQVFWPSSIAVFGPTTPREATPQHTILEPTTIYGVTKVLGELLCQYYRLRYGVDVRSVRYPGIISWKAEPGGGTTDFAVAIFYGALKEGKYTCFVREDTVLPMMYMDDAIMATLMLMDAESKKLSVHTSYNLAAMSFSAGELAEEIKKHLPLEMSYKPDERQGIADSWPMKIDDSQARGDWGWKHEFDLPKMTEAMIKNLKAKLNL